MDNTIDRFERELKTMNETEGRLTGHDCPICKNKGVIFALSDGYIVSRNCECMKIRDSRARLRASGLESIMNEYRFDRYEASDRWQKDFKKRAIEFIKDHERKWFFAGGQSGAGKTHICTAIASQFLKQGLSTRYMLWRDESVKIKSSANESSEYGPMVNPLKTVKVLYIDDLFKTGKDEYGNTKLPTPADINIAFEILNYRYNNDGITIISSERTIEELIDIDEAIGSRIRQRSKEYCFNFNRDRNKNYRLR